MPRDFDLVLFGATGFTGALTAQAIVDSDEFKAGTLRFALAGRNADKLAAVATRLGGTSPLPVVVVDAADDAGLRGLAERSGAIVTTVGPYLRHGLPLVKACAAAGTHYADLTGEPPFIVRSIAAAHDVAVGTGARITHCCGFDSIPSDLGTLLLQDAAIADGGPCDVVRFTLKAARGGVSGGTAHSLLDIMAAVAVDEQARVAMTDPFSLVPAGAPHGAVPDDSAHVDDDIGAWVAPFFMAPINARVVRRSNALLAQRYGDGFGYAEQLRTGRGIGGALGAHVVQAALTTTMATASTAIGRTILAKLLPAPGEGPDEKARDAGFFSAELHGHRRRDGAHFTATVKGQKDPGYGGTAIMLSQAALCLATDPLTSSGGVTTPAAAMGQVLISRLQRQGMTFTVSRRH